MPRPLEVWGITAVATNAMQARHSDGRRADLVRAIVRTSSRRAAAKAFGVPDSYLKDYGASSGSSSELTACAAVKQDGIVLIRGLDPGDTVMGTEDYVEWDMVNDDFLGMWDRG